VSFVGQAQKPSHMSINHIPLDFDLLTFSVLPGDSLLIKSENAQNISLSLVGGGAKELTKDYYWVAPQEPGFHLITLSNGEESRRVRFVVMKTMKEIVASTNDFRIDAYPKKPYKNLPQYRAPKGMIEVTKANMDTYISKHFQLKDFLCKQQSSYPKDVIISPKLLYKLELIISKLHENNYPVVNMHIMSGYRTPYYNAKIGNGKSSRHIYGDAADIFVDNDENRAMDDLNKDGKINIHDARILAKIVEEIDGNPKYKWMLGGLGVYSGNGAHQGFIHVDTRGYKARW